MAGVIVFDIMRYAVHDGPGIRTTVFLKGCPLNCYWCHNPESQRSRPQVLFFADRCIGCGDCAAACPHGVLTPRAGTDKDRHRGVGPEGCTGCGSCVAACCAGAREMAGREMSVAQLMREIERDIVFYDQSGGGVTFSGGEPLAQADWLLELLAACRDRDMHTAVDTCGFAPREKLLQAGQLTDLFLFDLKMMDDRRHREYTGVSNGLILDNLRALASRHHNIVIRIPVLPGLNDGDDNICATGEFLSGLPGVRAVHLLPYHRAGLEKYRRLGMEYRLPHMLPPSSEKMDALAEKLRGYGLTVRVGN